MQDQAFGQIHIPVCCWRETGRNLPSPARCGCKGETDNGLAAGARELRAVNQVAPHHCKPALDRVCRACGLRLFDVQPLGLCGSQGFQKRQGAANCALALPCPREPGICSVLVNRDNRDCGKLRLSVCRSSSPGLKPRSLQTHGSAFDEWPWRPEVDQGPTKVIAMVCRDRRCSLMLSDAAAACCCCCCSR